MAFDVAADAYDRFMGRYSRLLAPQFADFAGVARDQRVLDVGCGPGALTAVLVARLGAEQVTAVDPSPSFVQAVRARFPGVSVCEAPAESLPLDDGAFDVTLAQLVVHFMTDPVAGLSEMRRVTRANGMVAACVWDLAGGSSPLEPFWSVVRRFDPSAADESERPGTREGHLVELFGAAGLRDVRGSVLGVSLEHASFDEWWEPFTAAVGPAGSYVAGQDDERRADLREQCRAALGDGRFTITARAWAATGRV